jgi:outer membrane protein W
MKKIIFIIFAAQLFVNHVRAQDEGSGYFQLSYQTALPVSSDFSDYTGQFSGRGMGMDYRYMLTEVVSLTGSVGWNIFRDETERGFSSTTQLNDNTITITGKQFRYVNAVPLLLGTQYNMGVPGGFRPYAGVNLGTYFIRQRTEVGLIAFEDKNWHFGLAPEVGFNVEIGVSVLLNFNIRYNHAFEVAETTDFGYLGFNLGFAWGN